MPTTQTIPIDLNTRGANPVAFTHQGDTARSFVFEVYNNGEAFTLTGYTAKIGAILPADRGYYVIAGENMATGAISGNTITVTLPAAYTAKSGNGVLTIILTGSGGTLRPINVDFRIQKSADAPETVAGASDFPLTLQGYVDAWFDNNSDEYLDAWLTGALADQDLESIVNNWLDDHPEATTTVQDGSITWAKFSASLQNKIAVKDAPPLYFAALKLENKTGGRGDCNVFYGATNGIVDFGADANVVDLLAFLQDKEITKFDWAIISHYHGDHITSNFSTAINSLINAGIDFSECVFYLPHKGIDWSQFVGTDNMSDKETAVKTALTTLGIDYTEPNNGDSVLYNGVSISFLNIGNYTDYYSYMKNGRGEATTSTTYNNFSMVAEMVYQGKTIVMSGDIHDIAQDQVIDSINRCDIYKIEHHGVNSLFSQDWYAKITCGYAVANQYASDSYNTEQWVQGGARKLYEQGTKVLFTGTQTQILCVDYHGITIADGYPAILPQNRLLVSNNLIQENEDLNDYWHVDMYHCLMANVVTTLDNCPVTTAFMMEVINIRGADSGDSVFRRQHILCINGEEYFRRLSVNRTNGTVTAGNWIPQHSTSTNVTVDASNGVLADGGTLRVQRNGGVVLVRVDGTLLATSGTGWHTVYNGLPKAVATPSFNILDNDGHVVRANVDTNGRLQIANRQSSSSAIGTSFVYLAAIDS